MTKQEFIGVIESTYQYESLDDREGFQLFVEGFFGDVTVTINTDDTFNIDIDIFDENYDMHYGFEKFPAVSTLAYYKTVVSVLENEFNTNYALVKTQDFDADRGLVNSVGYRCKRFDIGLINHICEVLANAGDGMDVFHSNAYGQALLETISNDDDYKENSGFKLDGDRLEISLRAISRGFESRPLRQKGAKPQGFPLFYTLFSRFT